MQLDMISKVLHYIGKNVKDANVIQIGAMDGISYDDTRGFLDLYKWPALLVEPIPEIFTELKYNFKDRTNYTYEQCAITDFDGEVEMLTIPKIAIERENLENGYRGMSALYPLKNGFGTEYERDINVKNNYGINIIVPAISFNSLLKKHNIDKFDILICDIEGHDYSLLKQIDFKKYRPKFIRLEYVNLTDEEKRLTEQTLIDNGYKVDIGFDIDAVDLKIWEEICKEEEKNQSKEHKNESKLSSIIEQARSLSTEESQELLKFLTEKKSKMEITNNELTVVTGLWNIGRPGRDFSHYIEHFRRFLEFPVNMFIYIPKEYEYLVWEIRSPENTYVKLYELEDVKHLYAPFWDKTQQIRTNPEWYNQTGEGGWLTTSPQASLEWYNPIVQSKMFMLSDASIWDPFKSEYFIWLDAGISNTVYEKYFTDHRVLDKINPHLDSFLFLSYPYETTSEIHGFKKDKIDFEAGKDVKYVCRGGLFGGRKSVIRDANSDYYAILNNTLSKGLMGTEESVFSIMAHLNPYLYRRYELDGNGLVVKYIQNLLDDKAELVELPPQNTRIKNNNPSINNLKTTLYMLTFNFPEQVEHTLNTFKDNSPDWLDKPRKILIDNSTNDEARLKNKEIADRWGFEHIIRNENTGINGGRMFAAEHFQESDSDYYFFFEDDMGLHSPTETGYCRNGFRKYVPDLYNNLLRIMVREQFDFLKFSYTEVYMDNYIQVSWYNIPQTIRTRDFPDYDKLPVTGMDPNAPRTKFEHIDVFNELSYISGNVYYANWPMIVGKKGNQKMFLTEKWTRPYEQTWMSYMYQQTLEGNLKPAVLLASPVNHNRIAHYTPEERREN